MSINASKRTLLKLSTYKDNRSNDNANCLYKRKRVILTPRKCFADDNCHVVQMNAKNACQNIKRTTKSDVKSISHIIYITYYPEMPNCSPLIITISLQAYVSHPVKQTLQADAVYDIQHYDNVHM